MHSSKCRTLFASLSIQLGEFSLESNCSAPCGTGYEVYRAPIATPAAYGGKECNPFLFPLCNRNPCDNNIYQNCTFKCNGTAAFYNISTVQGNSSTLASSGCNITCVTLDAIDCLVSGDPEPDNFIWVLQQYCLYLKGMQELLDKLLRPPCPLFSLRWWEGGCVAEGGIQFRTFWERLLFANSYFRIDLEILARVSLDVLWGLGLVWLFGCVAHVVLMMLDPGKFGRLW